MNPASTDTRIYRPAEVVSKLGVQQNDGGKNYTARHSTENPPAKVSPLPQHVRTELIPVVPPEIGETTRRIAVPQLLVQVPLEPRPVVPAAVPAAAVPAPPEPVAPVTNALLERVLRGLRGLRRKP